MRIAEASERLSLGEINGNQGSYLLRKPVALINRIDRPGYENQGDLLRSVWIGLPGLEGITNRRQAQAEHLLLLPARPEMYATPGQEIRRCRPALPCGSGL